MDIDASKVIVQSKTSDRQEEINFLKSVGSRYSAMEHLVPEQMFSTEEAPAYGMSAVKAIALAAQEGQKIFTITQANLDTALSQISLEAEVEQEISGAVYAGHIVTTHEALVDFHGSLTAGYIIEDPTSGAGAYKISGGGNGGMLYAPSDFGLAMMFILFSATLTAGIAALIYFSAIYITYILTAITVISAIDFFVSIYRVFKECDSLQAVTVVMSMLVVELLLKVDQVKDWVVAFIYGGQKAVMPSGC